MPKVPKVRKPVDKPGPLDAQLELDERGKQGKGGPQDKRKAVRFAGSDDEGEREEGMVPRNLSSKILREARTQRHEMDAEASGAAGGAGGGPVVGDAVLGFGGAGGYDEGEGEGEGGGDSGLDTDGDGEDDGTFVRDGFVEAETDVEEERLLQRFLSPDAPKTLGELIYQKIQEAEEAKAGAGGEGPDTEVITPKIVEVFTKVGQFLARYKSGKLPKVFKLLPGLTNWEDLLFVTQPENWSAHAVFAATRIFASNLSSAMAQRFLSLVVLPAVRDDIRFNKKLNYHLYQALKKSLYKPGAFFKGVLIPLCEAGNSTLREALIISSVMKKVRVPQVHSAAALLKIASSRYSGATSVVLKALIDKKYALPNVVVEGVVDHFGSFISVAGPLPLVWHSCLLSFVQKYKADINPECKTILRSVLRVHRHPGITAEIRRELFGSHGDAE